MIFEKKRTGIELKFYELTQKIVGELGYILYDFEYNKRLSKLCLFIMDPKTNSAVIEDCVKVDKAFNPYCEEENWIPDEFVLEVSSPGVYRSLKNYDHFVSAVDEYIEFTLNSQLSAEQASELSQADRNKTKLRAKLVEVNTEVIKLEISGHVVSVAFDQIKKANLDPDLNA